MSAKTEPGDSLHPAGSASEDAFQEQAMREFVKWWVEEYDDGTQPSTECIAAFACGYEAGRRQPRRETLNDQS